MNIRVGTGIDIHPWEKGKKLYLGGIEIPYSLGLSSYSDGDILIHALIDALLGSMGMGDIGEYFPSSDEKFKKISSIILLQKIMRKIKDKGGKVINVDATIVIEEPMITPYKGKIKKNLSKYLEIPQERINIKAKTSEKLGFVGRKEGAFSLVTVLIEKK